MAKIDESDLTRFGIRTEDEGFHTYDPDDTSWNESWFWDWFDESGIHAGHCRIGAFPTQGRLWLWLYLYRDGEWLAIEQPRLDLARVPQPDLAFEGWGLRLGWSPKRPLIEGTLEVAGRARVVSGPRVGRMVDVEVTLEVEAAGIPHSTGQGDVEGHESEGFDARRFEQPIDVRATVSYDRDVVTYSGRGERDHSWGPRAWNIEWTFFALSRPEERLQFVEVRIKGFDAPLEFGYHQRPDGAQDLTKVSLTVEAGDTLDDAFSGRVDLTAEDGTAVAGEIELISAHEMDVSHTLEPVRGTRYHRALVRVRPDDGSEPLLGWLEDNRFFEDDPDRPDFTPS